MHLEFFWTLFKNVHSQGLTVSNVFDQSNWFVKKRKWQKRHIAKGNLFAFSNLISIGLFITYLIKYINHFSCLSSELWSYRNTFWAAKKNRLKNPTTLLHLLRKWKPICTEHKYVGSTHRWGRDMVCDIIS